MVLDDLVTKIQRQISLYRADSKVTGAAHLNTKYLNLRNMETQTANTNTRVQCNRKCFLTERSSVLPFQRFSTVTD